MTETFVGTVEEIRDKQNQIVLKVLSGPKNGMSALAKAIKVDLSEIDREKERKKEREKLVKDVVKEIRVNTGKTIVSNPKIGRNQLCPCGSGEKFKKCCRKKIDRRFLWNDSQSLKLT